MVHLAHHNSKSAPASPTLDHFHRNRWTNSPEYAQERNDEQNEGSTGPVRAGGFAVASQRIMAKFAFRVAGPGTALVASRRSSASPHGFARSERAALCDAIR